MRLLIGFLDQDRADLPRRLAAAGLRTETAESFGELPAIAALCGPFDLALPVVGSCTAALPALREIRRRGLALPVLVLAAQPDPMAESDALHAGADDVLALQAPLPLLLARLQALQRRTLGHRSAEIACGNVLLDQARQAVAVDGRPVRLTRREYDVLEMLLLRRGTVLGKEACMARLYGGEDGPEARIVDVFVCKLRRKLAAAGAAEILRTVWGIGYAAEEPGPAAIAAARARFAAGKPRARRAHLGAAPARGAMPAA
jgi:two-component system cell cycle response regulator CtrA